MGISKLYDNLYNEYVEHNKKHHLSKNDWLNCLPFSYREEIEKNFKNELSKDTLQTINFIEKVYKNIEQTQNTTNALDYINELKTYLDITYLV